MLVFYAGDGWCVVGLLRLLEGSLELCVPEKDNLSLTSLRSATTTDAENQADYRSDDYSG